MTRHRYGVVLLFPSEASLEVQGLSRACGGRLRIEPHITLVPPINLHEHQLAAAMSGLRRAAARAEPLSLTIGPVDTFSPESPVSYLRVSGDESSMTTLHEMQARLHEHAPFDRPPTYAYVPHVTLNEDSDDASIAAAQLALRFFSIDVIVDRVWLLWDHPVRRRWERVADVVFEPPAIRGRGGIELAFRHSIMPAAGVVPIEIAERSCGSIEALDHGKVVGTLIELNDDDRPVIVMADGYENLGIEDRLRTERS
jgi:2'-5' RNA ligase